MTHEEQIEIVKKHGFLIYIGTKRPEYTVTACMSFSTGRGYDPYHALLSLCNSAGLTREDRMRAIEAANEINGVPKGDDSCLRFLVECTGTRQRSMCRGDSLWETYRCFPYTKPD